MSAETIPDQPTRKENYFNQRFQIGALVAVAGVSISLVDQLFLQRNPFLSILGGALLAVGVVLMYVLNKSVLKWQRAIIAIIAVVLVANSLVYSNNQYWTQKAGSYQQTCSFGKGAQGSEFMAVGFETPVYYFRFIAWGLQTEYFFLNYDPSTGLTVNCPANSIPGPNITYTGAPQ